MLELRLSLPHEIKQNLKECFGDFLLLLFGFSFVLHCLLLLQCFLVFHLTSILLSLKYLVWVACKEFFFVKLVREGAAMAIFVGHGVKEKLVFLSPNVFVLPLK